MSTSLDSQLAKFSRSIESSLAIASSTEALWLTAPPASLVRRQLRAEHLEALYESAFMRAFMSWESFVEGATLRYLIGKNSPTYQSLRAVGQPRPKTLKAALQALLADGRPPNDPRDFLLWHNPTAVARRVGRWLTACPIEQVCTTHTLELSYISAVRHHIAHGSVDTRRGFVAAANHFAGSSYSGSPGRFLRADDNSDPLNRPRWIVQLCRKLQTRATEMVA